jgi:hypothetical protein
VRRRGVRLRFIEVVGFLIGGDSIGYRANSIFSSSKGHVWSEK